MNKSCIAFTFVCCFAAAVSAQQVGVRAGANFANARYYYYGSELTTHSNIGAQLGLVAKWDIAPPLSLGAGLLYAQKGMKQDVFGVEWKTITDYLEIPLELTYTHELSSVDLYAKAGPYLGLALAAKTKSGDNSTKIDIGSDDNERAFTDLGLNVGVGVALDNIHVGLTYGLGLSDIANGNPTELKNRVVAISLTWFVN